MDLLAKKVIARYQEGPNEGPPDMGIPWVEYIKNKTQGIPDPDNPVYEMLKGKSNLGKPFSQINPYDYDSPSNMPKDQKDSPPFVNDIILPTSYKYLGPPDLWGDNSSLEYWRKVREQDWTTDEDEQQPALSITRKKSSTDNGIDRYAMERPPLIIPENCLNDFLMRSKVAASLDEVVNKDYHYKNDFKIQRSGRCSVVWANKNSKNQRERGLFIFKVHSQGSSTPFHTVYLQFLRGDQEEPLKSYSDYPVHLGCTCPSFVYFGAQYYAVHDGYMYMPAFRPDLVAPKPQSSYTVSHSDAYPQGKKNPGRGLNFRVCKHILAVYDFIKTIPMEVHYKKYPVTAPPSKLMNKDVWGKIMKFEFNEQNIKQRLMSPKPKIPAYFNREDITPAVIDWFNQVWIPRTDNQKIKALQDLVEYPERIFFILMKEAYLKRSRGEKISDKLINEGYELMEKVVQPDNDEKPQSILEQGKDTQEGTGEISPPGGTIPASDFIKGQSQPVKQKTKPTAQITNKRFSSIRTSNGYTNTDI